MTEKTLQVLCKNQAVFQRGKQYFYRNHVEIIQVTAEIDSSFKTIHAQVSGSNHQYYDVEITLNDDRISSYFCSCPAFYQYDGLCKHMVATILQDNPPKKVLQIPNRATNNVPFISKSNSTPTVSMMINSYTYQNIAKTISSDIQNVELEPTLIVNKNTVEVSFKIGTTHKYILKDITAFAFAMKHCEQVEYGKKLNFLHVKTAFAQHSQSIVDFILELIKQNKAQANLYNQMIYPSPTAKRCMSLLPSSIDRFFDLMYGHVVQTELFHTKTKKLNLVDHNPKLTVTIAKKTKDCASLTLENIQVFQGEQHCYVCKNDYLYRCDHEFTQQIGAFLELAQSYESTNIISKQDLPAFCSAVLPVISKYLTVETLDISLKQFTPSPPTFRFHIDSLPNNIICCTISVSYGTQSFNLLKQVQHNSLYRDQATESQVFRVVHKYFPKFDQNHEMVCFQDDDDVLFNLLENGLAELHQMGEVFVSDKFKQLRVAPSPKISIGISIQSDLLNLTMESDDFDTDEIARVLKSYKLHKKYHRLKNGDFLRIEENSLSTISRIADGLNLTNAELHAKTLSLPKYRALYVDNILRDDQTLSYQRDSHFRSLIRNIKSVEDGDFKLPKSLEKILHSYQKTGFRWLKTMDLYGFGGILADDMGLGKTLQVIALLLSQKEEQPSTSLVVCPASLVYNWENEFEKFAPGLKTGIVSKGLAERKKMIAHYNEYDVLVTSYDLLKRDVDYYQQVSFRFQIIDEAQYIKNHSTKACKAVKQINSVTRFALTGTPIENRLSELWSIFDYLMPQFLYGYTQFKNDLELPIVRSEDEMALKRLHKMISPFILRRLKKDVLKQLPDKLEHVYYAKLAGEQHRLYKANVSKIRQQLTHQTESEYNTGKLQILAELTRLRQICCDPSLCFEEYKGESAKLDSCMELINNAISGGHQILLFSQFTSMLKLIQGKMDEQNIPYYSLTGATSKETRIALVEQFNSDQTPVFLISLKAGGTGLNLTSADIVIHYDPWWNVATQNQATDRAHRIGQKNVLTVYKLIAKDTIEEQILKLQESKQNLADSIITGSGSSIASLSKEDLIEILK